MTGPGPPQGEPRRSPWRVHVGELRRGVGERRTVEVEGGIDDATVGPSRLAAEPVEAHLELESVSGGIAVRGSLHARWEGECRRCLEGVSGPLAVEVDEVFEDVATEGETYPVDGDSLDLEPMVRESLLLALPLSPLCRDDCAGPDPAHFPVTVEDDDAPVVDPRWAALDTLREN